MGGVSCLLKFTRKSAGGFKLTYCLHLGCWSCLSCCSQPRATEKLGCSGCRPARTSWCKHFCRIPLRYNLSALMRCKLSAGLAANRSSLTVSADGRLQVRAVPHPPSTAKRKGRQQHGSSAAAAAAQAAALWDTAAEKAAVHAVVARYVRFGIHGRALPAEQSAESAPGDSRTACPGHTCLWLVCMMKYQALC